MTPHVASNDLTAEQRHSAADVMVAEFMMGRCSAAGLVLRIREAELAAARAMREAMQPLVDAATAFVASQRPCDDRERSWCRAHDSQRSEYGPCSVGRALLAFHAALDLAPPPTGMDALNHQQQGD